MKKEYSNYQPLWKIFFLFVFTFGLYLFWWSYETWMQIKKANFNVNFCKPNKKEYLSGQISPGLLTVSLILPIVNLFILYELFKSIISYSEINKIEKVRTHIPGNFLIGYIFFRIFFLHIISILMIQSIFNKCWKKVDKRPIKKLPYTSEWFLLILGPIFLFLLMISSYLDPAALLPTEYEEYTEDELLSYCEEFCIDEPEVAYVSVEANPDNESNYLCYCLDENEDILAGYHMRPS